MLLSMNTCLALVCGVSALFAVVESTSDSVSATSNDNSIIAEPNKTTPPRPISAHTGRDAQSARWNPTHEPADVSATAGTEGATGSADHSPTTAQAATASSSGQLLLRTATGAITAAGEAQTSPSTAITKAAHEPSPLTSTGGASSAASSATDAASSATDAASSATDAASSATDAASSATDAASLPEPSSATRPELASNSSSTDSPVDATQSPAAVQNFSSTSASITSTGKPSSKGAPSCPVTLSGASTDGAGLSSAPQPRSVTTLSTVASSNTGGSKSLTTTTQSTTAAAPCEHTKSTDVQPCSNRVVANQCLIVISSLAGLATIFMVSTIILCAQLTARKFRVKKPKEATEMMSFSALRPPEMNYNFLRQRNPVTNGVLVMHNAGDSDEDGGDNMTLISFLPENDHFV